MKIAFLSQMGFSGKIPRHHKNMRVEFAQMCALGAEHFPLYWLENGNMPKDYDHMILMIPKTPEDRDRLFNMDLVGLARNHSKKIWFMQEGPSWIFQDLPIHQQLWHYNLLQSVDGILTENQTDISYFTGLVGRKIPIHDIPSLMITDKIEPHIVNPDARSGVIIGGNMCRWYGGFDSYIIAQVFDEDIFAPSMGRKVDREEEMEISHLPYMEWLDWVNNISRFKYAIHLMPTIAAGTFAMNFSYHGIPCIGYEEADTQRNLHPLTSCKMGDLEMAREYAERLKDDKFYKLCSETTLKRYEKHHSEKAFLEHMNCVFN